MKLTSTSWEGEVESYRLSDVDLHHCCCAKGGLSSVSGLDHQGPLAVLLLGDVVHDLQRLDVRLELDLACGPVDLKYVVWVGSHDGVLDHIVRLLRIFIYSLQPWRTKPN